MPLPGISRMFGMADTCLRTAGIGGSTRAEGPFEAPVPHPQLEASRLRRLEHGATNRDRLLGGVLRARIMRRLVVPSVIVALVGRQTAVAAQSRGPLAVIVHPSNPVSDLSLDDLRRLYLGTTAVFPNKARVVLVVSADDRLRFYQEALRMSEDRFNRHWIARVFAGEPGSPLPATRARLGSSRPITLTLQSGFSRSRPGALQTRGTHSHDPIPASGTSHGPRARRGCATCGPTDEVPGLRRFQVPRGG